MKNNNLSNEQMKQYLNKNNFIVSIGLHGQIFITPIDKGNMFKRSFDTIEAAYNNYNTFFTT